MSLLILFEDERAELLATLIENIRTKIASLDAVGAAVGDKVRPGHLPCGEDPPAIVINIPEADIVADLEGEGGYGKAQVEVTCISPSAIVAWQLRDKVRTNDTTPGTGLAGFSGIVNGMRLDCVLRRDEYEAVQLDEGDDVFWHLVTSIYEVEFNESV